MLFASKFHVTQILSPLVAIEKICYKIAYLDTNHIYCIYLTSFSICNKNSNVTQVLSHWVSLERKFAAAVMDELLSSPDAWSCDEQGEGDGWSSCGEQLITLLHAITDR